MPNRCGLSELNAMGREAWTEALAGIFEASPRLAATAWEARPLATVADLRAAMVEAVRRAPVERKPALHVARPELAGGRARAGRLAEASEAEQASAGLDRLTGAEHARFERLNRAYRDRFGFPFIVAVRDHTKARNLESCEQRLHNRWEEEVEAASEQVFRIARIRLDDAGLAP